MPLAGDHDRSTSVLSPPQPHRGGDVQAARARLDQPGARHARARQLQRQLRVRRRQRRIRLEQQRDRARRRPPTPCSCRSSRCTRSRRPPDTRSGYVGARYEPAADGATILLPGATSSGFSTPSNRVGPREL